MDPVERDLNAHEAHASALATSLMLFLWGAVSIFVVPSRFRPIDVTHTCVGALAFGFFVATRRRPCALVAYIFCAAAIIDTLVLLPWITVAWCTLGRPFEALTVPEVGMLTVALVVPRSFTLGVVTMLLFLGEGVFVTYYAHRIGLQARLPAGEPAITIYFALPALGLLVLRDRRRQLARRYIRLQADTAALDRLTPLFARVREEMTTQIERIRSELAGTSSPVGAVMMRSLARLDDVDARLAGLTNGVGAPPPQRAPAVSAPATATQPEQEFLARDEQLGAAVLAVVVMLLAAGWAPVAFREISCAFALRIAAIGVVATAVLALLVATRHHPSRLRGRLAAVALFIAALVGASLNLKTFVQLGRPFTPFVGQKILMVTLGLATASWSFIGLPLILVTAGEALLLYFAYDFGALKDRISVVEPWVTLVFMVIGIAALHLRDQRRVASLALLRAESRASAVHRRAAVLLALRDQLNTPLQTLVVNAARLERTEPTRDISHIRAAIDRLVVLSRELAAIELPAESQTGSVRRDELRRASVEGPRRGS